MNKRFFVPLARCPAKGWVRGQSAKSASGPTSPGPPSPNAQTNADHAHSCQGRLSQSLRHCGSIFIAVHHRHIRTDKTKRSPLITKRPRCVVTKPFAAAGQPRATDRAKRRRPCSLLPRARQLAKDFLSSRQVCGDLYRGFVSRIKPMMAQSAATITKMLKKVSRLKTRLLSFVNKLKPSATNCRWYKIKLTAAKENQRADGPKACAREAPAPPQSATLLPPTPTCPASPEQNKRVLGNCVCLREHYNRCDHQGIISV